MPKTDFARMLLVALVLTTLVFTPPLAAHAQSNKPTPQPAVASSDAAALARIETALDARRKELNIPGMSLAIVKDDKVIYMKGLGVKDFERGVPVTPDTLFAIGSSSKAFTAMAAVMSQDDGKLSLDDSPKKLLPYFKLHDAEADSKITIRDLLSHRSGLNRTELAWITGRLNREEIIRVAGLAKPTAKLGERFLYQNVMYTAAGEAVARAQKQTWDDVIRKRIFQPLGMKRTVTTVPEMTKSDDYSFGYDYAPATKVTRRLPTRDFPSLAPAGAINSSANDMAQWVRLMLGGGMFDGKRLVSEAGMAEITKPQIEVAGKTFSYGLGWFLREWKGNRVVEHGGNIDGFNALVAMLPEKRLGFVLLTNVTSSPIGETAMETIWSNLAGETQAPAAQVASSANDAERKVGKYLLAEANMTIEITSKDGKLTASVPGQPVYTLEDTGAGRYALTTGGTTLPNFFASFRAVKTDEAELEIFLEQPQGNFVLRRIKEASGGAEVDAVAPEAMRALVGRYETKGGEGKVEVAEVAGKVSLVVAGQPPYALIPREKDLFTAAGLPDGYAVQANRDAAGKVTGITLRQPQGNFEFARADAFKAPMTVDELMAKVVAAVGGEAALRRHTSLRETFTLDLEHQGVTGKGTISQRAPNLYRQELQLSALGKEIATASEIFDGTRGVDTTSFTPVEELSGAALANRRIGADFHQPLNWRTLFKTVEITGTKKVGDEESYVVKKTPAEGHPITDYVSTTTFRVLRRDSVAASSTSDIALPVTETFSDFRTVESVLLPFKTVTTHPTMGTITLNITDARFNVPVADNLFRAPVMRAAAATGK